jgi:hypothetical protein
MEEPNRPQITIWRKLIACYIPKVTNKNIRIYINKNVNVRLFKILYLRNFFTDCFEILTQPCIPIRACFYIPIIYMPHPWQVPTCLFGKPAPCLDLDTDCFSHGQLYVACSIVGKPDNLYICTGNGTTKHIVYPQAGPVFAHGTTGAKRTVGQYNQI